MTHYIQIDGENRDVETLTTIPSDRVFREAWQFDGDAVEIDMTTAKNIWRAKIRDARIPELEKLDTEFMKALESGGATTQIVADKQVLRDAPAHPDIEKATTADELKKVQPIPGVTIE